METSNLYEQERLAKLAKLRALGVDPYGERTDGVRALDVIRKMYQPEMGHDGGPEVVAAGRVMLKRDMGKLSFLTLRDETGDLQVALDKKRISERDWQVRDLIDLGDLLVVTGKLGQTNKGEITIWANSVSMAAKALLPPPAKWEGLSDVELRYRQRYVDLWANPEVMKLARLRIRVIEEIRKYMIGRGFLEVETPMMQIQAGGAAARPFVTHHNALDIPLFLRIAPELFLKRLLVGGFSKVFEINRNFRNEGISPRHNPEFTMLEAYEAFGSWETMADLIEGLICHVAETVCGGLRISHHGGTEGTEKVINLQRPWRRISMMDLVAERTGWKFDKRPLQDAEPDIFEALTRENTAGSEHSDEEIEKISARAANPQVMREQLIKMRTYWPFAKTVSADLIRLKTPAEQLVEVYEKFIEPTLINPCFVTHVPSVIIPLARKNRDDPYFADVYELAINGVEISPGYTELNDPEVQAANFAHQVGDAAEQQKSDEDFLHALRYGMPPAGGLGMGVDRLLMLLSGAQSIRDVILFPLMRPT